MNNGGLETYCPKCDAIEICAAGDLIEIEGYRNQRWQHDEYGDLNWFERGRTCQKCGTQFTTVEIEKERLHELIDLREKVQRIQLYTSALKAPLPVEAQLQNTADFLKELNEILAN